MANYNVRVSSALAQAHAFYRVFIVIGLCAEQRSFITFISDDHENFYFEKQLKICTRVVETMRVHFLNNLWNFMIT